MKGTNWRTAAVVLAMALAAAGCAGWKGAEKEEMWPLKYCHEAGFGMPPGAAVSIDEARALVLECATASGADMMCEPYCRLQIGDWYWFELGSAKAYCTIRMKGWAVNAKTGEVRSLGVPEDRSVASEEFWTLAGRKGGFWDTFRPHPRKFPARVVLEGLDETARLEAWRKLGEIRVPRLEFRNAAPADVLVWLAQAMLAAHPEDCGVSCFGDYSAENAGAEREKTLREAAKRVRVVPPEAMAGLPPVTADLTDVPVRNVALYLGKVWGFRMGLEADGKGWVFQRDYSGWGMRLVEEGGR
ncbi:MAG: hypothetical protein IJT88_07690 [Kiritimatiellae bacterium]|nr:hypothetical protein [Kiritimatiellia bacterium]